MLAPRNYIQWKSRIKCYIDTKPNREHIYFCLMNPPYELGWNNKPVLNYEGNPTIATARVFEMYKNVEQEIRDQLNAEAEAIQIILTGIDNDIYSKLMLVRMLVRCGKRLRDVFAIPYALPPQRSFDHKIILRDESTMVNIKPYRYPPNQKDVIEAMTMREHTLFAKQSKCVFGTTHVEYLRHVISKQGVATDLEKIKAMQNSPVSTTLKHLRNRFLWNPEAQIAFNKLEQAMTEALVLALPDFLAEFVIETDALGYGIGVVLQRNNRPISFLSKTLSLKHQSIYAYERELSVVVLA
nr:hypothetical protein [Tanacetum cinerariifolium]